MPYCGLCSGLTIEKLWPPNVYYHANTLATFEKSSRSCDLCRVLKRYIDAADGGWSKENPQPFDSSSPSVPWLVEALKPMFAESTSASDDRIDPSRGPEISTSSSKSSYSAITTDTECEESQTYNHATNEIFGLKLQILEESPRPISTVGDYDGFTHIGIWTRSKKMHTSVTLMVEEEVNGSIKYISGRVLTTDDPPQAFFSVAQRWHMNCSHNHSQCRSDAFLDGRLPDRVIDVALHGGDPRLVMSKGMISRYATLSHCWGGHVPMITLLRNFDQRTAGIPYKDLPKTFREAVMVCRALKIPYLWIDSLCIIQDSLEDWENQSSQMHSIYYNSAITLAALDAKNSSEGLFLPKKPFVDINPLARAFADGRGQAYIGPPSWNQFTHCVGPVLESDSNALHTVRNKLLIRPDFIKLGLLETRAWVMQELRLSRRVLYFFHGAMSWRCTEATWHQNGCCEHPRAMYHLNHALEKYEKAYVTARTLVDQGLQKGSLPSFSDDSDYDSDRSDWDEELYKDYVTGQVNQSAIARVENRGQRKKATSTTSDYHLNKMTHEAFMAYNNCLNVQDTWYSIVGDYSQCQMTFPEDKLPALSGVAARFQTITKDQYLAGHWRIHLHQSLFWRTGPGASRSTSYQAPSWSWASIEGILTIPPLVSPLEIFTEGSIRVLQAFTEVHGDNPFGRVTSGKIVARASVLTAKWDPGRRGWLSASQPFNCSYDLFRQSPTVILDSDGNVVGHWTYDEDVHSMFMRHVFDNDVAPAGLQSRMNHENLDIMTGNDDHSERMFYEPEELLLVKGPVVREPEKVKPNGQGSEAQRQTPTTGKVLESVNILVLHRRPGESGGYERVGVGSLGGWDDSVATVRKFAIF